MLDINFNLLVLDQNNLDVHKFLFKILVMLISEKSTYRSYSRHTSNQNDNYVKMIIWHVVAEICKN